MVGSTAEDTKCGLADEFDILLEFNEISSLIQVICQDTIKFLIKSPVRRENFDQCFPEYQKNQCLPIQILHLRIFQVLTSFLHKESPWEQLSFVSIELTRVGFAIFLRLENNNAIIKLDVIPAFRIGNSNFFVFNGQKQLQESSVIKEVEHFASLPENAKTGYIIAKSIRGLLGFLIDKPFLSQLVDKAITSYSLKHALFHIVDKQNSQREVLKAHEFAREIYHMLMKQNDVQNFFTKQYVFADNHIFPKQMYLNHFVTRKLQVESFSNDVRVSEYRALFSTAISQFI